MREWKLIDGVEQNVFCYLVRIYKEHCLLDLKQQVVNPAHPRIIHIVIITIITISFWKLACRVPDLQ